MPREVIRTYNLIKYYVAITVIKIKMVIETDTSTLFIFLVNRFHLVNSPFELLNEKYL